ncbi:MAG: RNA methyltransferase [Fuerstiella sp.]
MPNRSTDENIVRLYRRLLNSRDLRDQRKQFPVDGIRNIVAAEQNRWQIQHIIRSRTLLKSLAGRTAVATLQARQIPVTDVSPEQFRSLNRQPRASGVLAIVGQKLQSLAEVTPAQHAIWIAMTRIRSQGNLGTLMRSSAALGGSGLIFIGDNPDPFDPNVLRSAMGSTFRQTLIRTSWSELNHESCKGWTIIGADASATQNVAHTKFPRGSIIMLGDERKGLSSRQKVACQQLVKIPMRPESDSLNIAIAGSILLYQAQREIS